jgi:hypothetical protein
MPKKQRIYYEASDADSEIKEIPEFNAEQIRRYQEEHYAKCYHPHDSSKFT